MVTQEQLIHDIKLLPDTALQAVGIIVQEILTLNIIQPSVQKPIYGSGKGKMWIADDFEAPLEELKEYME